MAMRKAVGDERRLRTRVRTLHGATLLWGSWGEAGHLVDLSLRGCRMRVEAEGGPGEDTPVTVVFHLEPGGGPLDIPLAGTVVRRDALFCAVAFEEVGLEVFPHLVALVRAAADDPDCIGGELGHGPPAIEASSDEGPAR